MSKINTKRTLAASLPQKDGVKSEADPSIGKMFWFNPKTFMRTVAADKKRIARENAKRKGK